ncbi:MAG: SUMF1/EgtB/PvdO family nonheme iron enzyme, partial [Saprospiraceae bacterium]
KCFMRKPCCLNLKTMKSKFFLLRLIISGCSASHKIEIETTEYKVFPPTGTVEISPNFYADISEMTTIGYREYLSWLDLIYGKDSEIRKEAQFDANVWYDVKEDVFARIYFSHPSYTQYPIVGITLEQAKKYSEWRTERVVEQSLIAKGLIEFSLDRTPENHFTIERYMEGKMDWIVKQEDFLVAEYTIPTEEEWEQLVKCEGAEFSCMNENSRENKKMKKNRYSIYNTRTEDGHMNLSMVDGWQGLDTKGMYGLIGNVSEMVDKEGVSKGGHWNKSLEEIKENISDTFEEANSWTGFRNVCRYKLVKIKD